MPAVRGRGALSATSHARSQPELDGGAPLGPADPEGSGTAEGTAAELDADGAADADGLALALALGGGAVKMHSNLSMRFHW